MRKVFVLVLVSLIVMLTMPLMFTSVALGLLGLEAGCCEGPGPTTCYSGPLLDPLCCIEQGGSWNPGEHCCPDGRCHECRTDDHCPDGYICNPETYECEEEVPEFPAGVTAVFGATLFIFLMMRRKYIRK